MKFTKREVNAAFHEFSSIASALSGKRVPVKLAEPGHLGYTTEEGIIYLAVEGDSYEPLSKQQGFILLRGIFTHETLHVLITDFTKYIPAIKRHQIKNYFESRVFANILNICEDGAIEYFAPDYMSREYVRSLEFTRATLYEQADEVGFEKEDDGEEEPKKIEKDPFAQFMSAVLHFRFFGFLKGDFTNTAARDVFVKCIPELSAVFEEPRQAKRIEHAENILELSRPLWEERAKEDEAQRKAMEELMDAIMKAFGVSENNGNGKGSDNSDPSAGAGSSLSKRREVTIRKVSAEEYKKAKEESDPDGSIPDGDIGILIPDEPVEDDEPAEDASVSLPGSPVSGEDDEDEPDSNDRPSDEDKDPDDADDGSDSGEPIPDDASGSDEPDSCTSPNGEEGKPNGTGKSAGDSNDRTGCDTDSSYSSDESNGDERNNSGSDQHNDSSGLREHNNREDTLNTPEVTLDPDDFTGSQDMSEEIEKELHLSEEELSAIHELNERFTPEEETEKRARAEDDEDNIDFPVGGGFKNVCKKAKCQNVWVKCSKTAKSQAMYDSIVQSMSGGITSLASQLKRILRNRQEESMYKTSGKVSVKRLNCGRVTSRVFNKKRYPDAADLAVAIAIDISGSMSTGGKIVAAQKAAIALAEVFGKLNIPVYMFGFTADEGGYDVNHYHYINWSNTKSDRLRLLSIKATSNNFDGYSIRYAAELLRRKDADKKLLLVISDGNPAACAYRSIDGHQDVQLAVGEANRIATTIGILLGNINPKYHRQMYGYNFVHCQSINDLFPQLAKILKKYI